MEGNKIIKKFALLHFIIIYC